MGYALAADLVLLLHLAFILFVVSGGLLLLWRRWWGWLHLPAVGWAVWIELSGSICPLTPLENQFRQLAGETGYAGGFIAHYLLPVIYPPGLTAELQVWLAISVVVVNLTIYGWIIHRWRRPEKR